LDRLIGHVIDRDAESPINPRKGRAELNSLMMIGCGRCCAPLLLERRVQVLANDLISRSTYVRARPLGTRGGFSTEFDRINRVHLSLENVECRTERTWQFQARLIKAEV
jgi:hypothetical protein